MIEGALILLAGTVLGWLSHAGVGRLRRPRQLRSVCDCTHPWGAHDEKGTCGAEVERQMRDEYGNKAHTVWVPCPCRRYSGPIPIEAYGFPQLSASNGP